MCSRASSIDALLKILVAAAIIPPNLAGDVSVLLDQVTNTDAWPATSGLARLLVAFRGSTISAPLQTMS
jgi:hypothetical protein